MTNGAAMTRWTVGFLRHLVSVVLDRVLEYKAHVDALAGQEGPSPRPRWRYLGSSPTVLQGVLPLLHLVPALDPPEAGL